MKKIKFWMTKKFYEVYCGNHSGESHIVAIVVMSLVAIVLAFVIMGYLKPYLSDTVTGNMTSKTNAIFNFT